MENRSEERPFSLVIYEYALILWKWAWLIILCAFLAATAAYLISIMQTPVYEANSLVMVTGATGSQPDTSSSVYLAQQLTQTYAQWITTTPVLEGVSSQFGLSTLLATVSAKPIPNTQLMRVTVTDTDPNRTAQIANALVDVLIQQNEQLQAGRYTVTAESIQTQITQVQNQISDLQNQIDQVSAQSLQEQLVQVESQITPLQNEIATLEADIKNLESANAPTELAQKQARLAQLKPILALYQQVYSNLVVMGKPSGTEVDDNVVRMQKTIDLYQQIYLQLLSNLESVKLSELQNTPNVVMIQPAVVPDSPISPKPIRNALLGAMVGLLLSGSVVILITFFDDTIKSPQDVENTIGFPVSGFIAETEKLNEKDPIYVLKTPHSPISEGYRILRANLEASNSGHDFKTMLISSSGPGEGKTTIAVNLAVIMAQAGKRVVLIDADMRRPNVHRYFGFSNHVGLSTLFKNIVNMQAIIHPVKDVKNLAVITSGKLPSNPSELLGSERMEKIISELIKFADLVILDCPPSIVADAQVLAQKADGILFIIQPGKTRTGSLKSIFEQFNRAGVKILGIVFNRIPRNRGYYYGGYQHYAPNNYRGYHYYAGKENDPGSRKGLPQTSQHRTSISSIQPKDSKNSQDSSTPSSSWGSDKKK